MRPIRSIPETWFVCPISKRPLVRRGMQLVGGEPGAEEVYTLHEAGEYWDFMPDHATLAAPVWRTWEQLQENGVVTYMADPKNNLGVGKRDDFLNFADFCGFRGSVLDIGVGPQRCPTHIEFCQREDVFFVGIDPLVGEQPRCFAFVRGLGEYLPFRDGLFDQVLFVTSLDHFIDPRPALMEAARVAKRGGEICVWLGEKDRNAPKPAIANPWYEKLAIPEGADDRFHFKRFSSTKFESYLRELRLDIFEKATHRVDQWRSNLFYRIRPE